MENLKLPPYSIESEQSVLGSLLILQKADRKVGEIFDLLRPDMFYNLSHQIIFAAMVKLGAQSDLDLVTVAEELENQDKLLEAGDYAYIGELARNTPSSANVLSYAEIVVERYNKRQIISIAHHASDQLYNGGKSLETIEYINREIEQIDFTGSYEPKHISEKIAPWMDNLQARNEGKLDAVGLKTGVKGLDDQIIGIKPNWLITLGGRPSMGKTIICQLINAHISRTLPTLFFTMEMDSDEIMDRYVGVLAGVEPSNLRTGALSDTEWGRVNPLIDDMKKNRLKIHYDETAALSVEQIAYRVKSAIKRIGKIGLVTIDYLELMQRPKAERDDISIGTITRKLKQLAKETQTPILLLAQANRETDKVKRPRMGNLAGSKSIEADSDLVIFAHREEVDDETTAFKGVIEIIPAKFRHGTCTRSIYLKRSEDKDGGRLKCLDIKDVAAMKNTDDARSPSASTYKPFSWNK